MYKYLFFDLDGTLTQSEFGIINSITYALEQMGIKVADRESVKRFIGPPLIKALKEFYQMNDEDADKAAKIYRERYSGGEMFNAPLYPGIEDVVKTLHENGFKLYVVTSKPTVYAKKIVEHFNILQFFENVIGPELGDKSYSKDELVAAAIKEAAGDNEINLADYVMIGDRFYDIDGANANSIDSIGVLYGYGKRDELEKAGATHIAETAEDILKVKGII
ncbi:MAG: HAD hydrolase-like protein [Eubacterium sp.]|nr:HAD hydrolase-like protein [Eubacterium sp.]